MRISDWSSDVCSSDLIFLAPVVSLDGAVLTLTVIPALAAALVGRFSSFGLAVGAALVIGVLQSLLSLFQADIARAVSIDPLSLTGLPQAVPMAIIVAGTVVAGRSRMTRGASLVRLRSEESRGGTGWC